MLHYPAVLRQPLHLRPHHVSLEDREPSVLLHRWWVAMVTEPFAVEWSLLFVLDPPVEYRSRARAVWRFNLGLKGGPRLARGIACRPQQLQAVVDALHAAGYPVTHTPISDATCGG